MLHRLFVALVATALGTWVRHTHVVDDDELAVRMARHLGARLEQSAVTDSWLKTLSLERLTAMAADLFGHPVVGSFTKKQLRALILEVLPRKADYVPKELAFHGTEIKLAVDEADEETLLQAA